MRAMGYGAALTALAAVAIGAVLAQEPLPPGPAPQAEPAGPLSLDLDGMPLGDFLKRLSAETRKVFLVPDRLLELKIYAKSPRGVAPKDLYALFLSILDLQGFAATTVRASPDLEVVKVVESGAVRRHPTRIFDAEEILRDPSVLPRGEEMVTVTCRLRHANVREVAEALSAFVDPNQGGQVGAIESTNTLLLADFAPNAERLVRVASRMDLPHPETEWEVVPLAAIAPDAAAAELRKRLLAVGRTRVAAIPIATTGNSIVLVGRRDDLAAARGLVRELDVRPGAGPRGEGRPR
ncbi:MAG: hypothetical protein L0216_02165 [Planctomycetales bacterium]|nr:hypothetical protein [Planctomycetales bacterium]